jgi:hypothetical protein
LLAGEACKRTDRHRRREERVPARLAELYRPGDPVEVYFAAAEEWRRGVVVALQPPGVWVRTEDGAIWFVTNGQRIRPRGNERP